MTKPLTYSERERSPAYQLWQASNAWRREVNKVLEPLGLTHVQFLLLASIRILREEDAQVSQVAVARFAAVDENMNSQVIRVLEKKGFVRRVHSELDKRAILLELTTTGEQLTDRARSAVKLGTNQFFAPLGDEAEHLAELLGRLSGCPSKG